MSRSHFQLREPYARIVDWTPPWIGAPAGTLMFAPGPESCRKDDGSACAAGDPISTFWDLENAVSFAKEADDTRPLLQQDACGRWYVQPDGVDDRLFHDLGSDFTVFDAIVVATRATDVGPLNGDYQSSHGQAAYEINQRNALWGGGLPLEDPSVLPAGVPSVRANTYRSSGTCVVRTNGIQRRTGTVSGHPVRQMRLFLNNYDDSASDGALYWLQVLPGAVFDDAYRARVSSWLKRKYAPCP